MAFYSDENDDELGQEGAPQQSAIVGQGGAPGAGQEPPAANIPKPSSFVGISDYIKANKQQAQGLTKDLGGYVEGVGNKARETIQNQSNLYNQDVSKNTVNLDQGIFNTAKTNAEKLNQNQKTEFQKMRDAQYKGPTSIESTSYYQPAQQSVQAANEATAKTFSEEGQRDLLAGLQSKNSGRVNQGILNFDAALIQGSPEARASLDQSLKTARDKNAALDKLLSDIKASSMTAAQKAAATTKATRDAIQGTFAGDKSVQKQLESSLKSREATKIAEATKLKNDTLNALNSGKDLSDSQLKMLGLSRSDYDAVQRDRKNMLSQFGKREFDDLSRYITSTIPQNQINAQNVASADEYARYAALNELMGSKNQFLSNPSLAGKANTDTFDINRMGLITDMTDRFSDYIFEKNEADRIAKEQAAAEAARKAANKSEKENIGGMLAGEVLNPFKGLQPAKKIAEEVTQAAGTYVCTALLNRRKVTASEFKRLHDLQLGSFLRRGRFAAWYIEYGPKLVRIASSIEVDWDAIKKWFVDDVLALYEKGKKIEAEAAYGLACKKLCVLVGKEKFYDEKVERNSYIDSLQFLPKILGNKHNKELIKSKFKRK